MRDMTVRVKMEPIDKILLKRMLNKNGEAQRFMTHEVRRLSDQYVPLDTGTLKNTAIEETSRILYQQKYAKRQYYNNSGSGMRGKYWDRRMIADRGHELVMGVARFVGGRA